MGDAWTKIDPSVERAIREYARHAGVHAAASRARYAEQFNRADPDTPTRRELESDDAASSAIAAMRRIARSLGMNKTEIYECIKAFGLRRKWKVDAKVEKRAARVRRGLPMERQVVPPAERRTVPLGLRFQVLARDGHRCKYCGVPASEAKLAIDHVHPFSKGGKTEIDKGFV